MKTPWLFALALVALVGLGACGPLQEDSPLVTSGETLLGWAGIIESDSPVPVDTSGLTRAQIESQPVNLLRLSLITFGSTSLFAQSAENGPKVTWISPEDISVTFEDGLLIGTRGIGDDLMGADVSGARASLRSEGNHLRTMDFLNGLGLIERRTYQCATVQTDAEKITIFERTYATAVLEETCTSDMGEFKNTYWRDSNGIVWQSRQWISDRVGYLGYQRL